MKKRTYVRVHWREQNLAVRREKERTIFYQAMNLLDAAADEHGAAGIAGIGARLGTFAGEVHYHFEYNFNPVTMCAERRANLYHLRRRKAGQRWTTATKKWIPMAEAV